MTDRIDRYVRGELSPQEARTLAQSCLDSPDLFDELTDAALAKAALNPRTVRTANVLRTWRKTAVLTGGLVAAAVLVVIVLPHPSSRRAPNINPVLDPGSNTSQPVLLASGLHPASAPVFRGGETDSPRRKPQGRSCPRTKGARIWISVRWTGWRKAASSKCFAVPTPSHG